MKYLATILYKYLATILHREIILQAGKHGCLPTNHNGMNIIAMCYHNFAQRRVGKQKDER